MPRHERAQRRQRPGLADHQGRAARRPLRGERAEGVDLGRPRGRLLHVLRAHRPRGAEAPRHQRADHRHAHARHRLPAAARADRPATTPTSTRSSSPTWRCPRRTCWASCNHGWAVSQGSLRHERGMLWIMNVSKMERTLKGLVRLAARPDGHGGTLGDDPRLAEAIGRLATDTAAMRCLGYRGFAKATRGEMPPEHMVLKLFTSEAEQRACLLGAGGAGAGGPRPRRPGPQPLHRVGPRPLRSRTGSEESAIGSFYDGAWALQYLRSFSGTIAGGHLGDPAQHRGRARARPAPGVTGARRGRPGAPTAWSEVGDRGRALSLACGPPSTRRSRAASDPSVTRPASRRHAARAARGERGRRRSTPIAAVLATASPAGCAPRRALSFQARTPGSQAMRRLGCDNAPHNTCVGAHRQALDLRKEFAL